MISEPGDLSRLGVWVVEGGLLRSRQLANVAWFAEGQGGAKPCWLCRPEGMKNPLIRGELRAGHLARWGWDRLFAVANSLGYEVVITLRPRTPSAAA